MRTFAITLGEDEIGLALEAQLVDDDFLPVGAPIIEGFVERERGQYWWKADIADDFQGGVEFRAGGVLYAMTAIDPHPQAIVDPAPIADAVVTAIGVAVDPLISPVPGVYAPGTAGAALGRIGVGVIEAAVAITSDGNIFLIRGDSYTGDDALVWSDPGTWPSLVEAVLRFSAAGITIDAEAVNAGIANQQIKVEILAEDSRKLRTGAFDFDVEATWPTGRVKTLVQGFARIKRDVTTEPIPAP